MSKTIATAVAALVDSVDRLDLLADEGHELPADLVAEATETVRALTATVRQLAGRVESAVNAVAARAGRGKPTGHGRPTARAGRRGLRVVSIDEE